MATYKISSYTVSPTEEFFFDTNVWFFLFAPIAGSEQIKQEIYSKLFREILSRNATIWINAQVIAEYINRYLRIEFDQWRERTKNYGANYKNDFRTTSDYSAALDSARTQISAILQKSERIPDDFNAINIDSIIASMGAKFDYGDAIFIDLCNRKKFKLVTDDSDMTKEAFSFSVITA